MVDKKDRRLLLELLKNGRLSFSDLARRCYMSRQGVFSRVKSLKRKGVIQNFTVNLNNKKIGLNVKAFILVETKPLRDVQNKDFNGLRILPQISQIHNLFGRYSYLIEVIAGDVDELKDIVRKIHDLEIVIRTETMMVYKSEKNKPQDPFMGILNPEKIEKK